MQRPAGLGAGIALVACALGACAAERYDHDMLESARRRLVSLGPSEPGGCEIQDAAFLGEEGLRTKTPLRLVLSCRGGAREAFLLSPTAVAPADSVPRFLAVTAQDLPAKQDLARLTRLLDRVFVGDPWIEPVITFNPGNAVGLPYQLAIIAFVVTSLAAGLAFVFLSRPRPRDVLAERE